MSHDKIKAAARKRMAVTGEPYTAARQWAIHEHNADHFTSPVSAADVRAAAEVHQELGPDYSDAVVAAFIDKVDEAVAARVEARLAEDARSKPTRRQRPLIRRVARDVLAASAGALVVVGAVGLHEVTSPHPVPPLSRVAAGTCASKARAGRPCFIPGSKEVQPYVITGDGQLKAVVPPAAR